MVQEMRGRGGGGSLSHGEHSSNSPGSIDSKSSVENEARASKPASSIEEVELFIVHRVDKLPSKGRVRSGKFAWKDYKMAERDLFDIRKNHRGHYEHAIYSIWVPVSFISPVVVMKKEMIMILQNTRGWKRLTEEDMSMYRRVGEVEDSLSKTEFVGTTVNPVSLLNRPHIMGSSLGMVVQARTWRRR